MLSLASNGFTSTQIIDATKAKDGTIQRRFRFELLDKSNNLIRETDNVINGEIKHVSNNRIKRGGSMVIRHQNFTLTDDYVATGQSGTELMMSRYNVQVANQSPIFYWRLGDTSGTSAVDASGNSRPGTYTGGFTLNQNSLLPGESTNGAVLLNGSSGYITRASESAFNVSALTAEAWVKSTNTTTRQTIICRDDVSTNRQFILRTLGTSTDTGQGGYIELVLFFTGSVTVRFTASANVCDGYIHHVVATYDGVNVKIYVDGKNVLTTAETRSMLSVTTAVFVGMLGNSSTYWNGTIDEVAMYGYAVTAAQVRSHYQAGKNDLGEINYLRDKIKVYCAIKMSTNGTDGTPWAEYPLGIFVFGYPAKNVKKTGTEWRAQLYDQSFLLDKRKRSTPYTIASGTNYQTAIAAAFVAAGFTSSQYSIATTSSVLPAQKNWPIGTSYLDIINDLLRAINYRELHFNGAGVAICEPYVLPGSRASEFTYTADANSILVNAFELSTNLNDTYNRVIFERRAPKLGDLVSTQSNMNVTHPTSIPALEGEIFLYHDPNVDAADQTSLDGLAQKKLTEVSEVYQEIRRDTPLIPFHDDLDKLTVVDTTNEISADFIEYEWTIPLIDTAQMNHVWRYTLPVI